MSRSCAQWRAMRGDARTWLARKLQLATPYELGYGF